MKTEKVYLTLQKGFNMTEQQLHGIHKFANRYRDTLENSSWNKEVESRKAIDYCLQVLNIHLDYAEIEREIEVKREFDYHNKGETNV